MNKDHHKFASFQNERCHRRPETCIEKTNKQNDSEIICLLNNIQAIEFDSIIAFDTFLQRNICSTVFSAL